MSRVNYSLQCTARSMLQHMQHSGCAAKHSDVRLLHTVNVSQTESMAALQAD